MSSLELINLEKRYGETQAVRGVNLNLPSSQYYCCLLGPSGYWKNLTPQNDCWLMRINNRRRCHPRQRQHLGNPACRSAAHP